MDKSRWGIPMGEGSTMVREYPTRDRVFKGIG